MMIVITFLWQMVVALFLTAVCIGLIKGIIDMLSGRNRKG